MSYYPIDNETIPTTAGNYQLDWFQDENADQPYSEGFTLLRCGGKDYIDILEGDTASPVALTVLSALRAHANPGGVWDREFRSGAAIVRYLRLAGKKGVTLTYEDFTPDKPSTDRTDRVYGVSWAPDDATDPDKYTRLMLEEWAAWRSGDAFGWRLSDPAGEEVESCWGYFNFDRERAYILDEATTLARNDAEDRVTTANRPGSGFIGLI